jgi:hypothetical protein
VWWKPSFTEDPWSNLVQPNDPPNVPCARSFRAKSVSTQAAAASVALTAVDGAATDQLEVGEEEGDGDEVAEDVEGAEEVLPRPEDGSPTGVKRPKTDLYALFNSFSEG